MTATRVWHPWAADDFGSNAVKFERGRGVWVFDTEGNRYLDGRSAALNAALGYSHDRVIDAMSAQARRLMHADLAASSHEPVERLSGQIARLMPAPLSETFFCSSGSEATEAATKLARMYHQIEGRAGRQLIVSLAIGYHGATAAAVAATELRATAYGNDPAPYARMLVRASSGQSDLPSIADVRGQLAAVDQQALAAFIIEPILGVGGPVLPPPGYLAAIREICTDTGMLMIVDEVMTGFGRTGQLFAFQFDDVVPDIVLTSKGLGAGYVPISAVTTTQRIRSAFARDPILRGFRHGHTMSGNPVACATAATVLDVIEDEALVENANRLGKILQENIRNRTQGRLTKVSGRGLFLVVDVSTESEALAWQDAAFHRGLLLRRQGERIVVAPPLNINEAELDDLTNRLLFAFDDVHSAAAL